MLEILQEALDKTLRDMEEDFPVAPIEAWNESVFRFIFCKNLKKQDEQINQLIECNRIDLVLHQKGPILSSSFIEFKFYIHSNRANPCTQKITGLKSFPSDRNFSELGNSAKQLGNKQGGESTSKFIILFYADLDSCKSRRYDNYYKNEIIKVQEVQEFEWSIAQEHRKIVELRDSTNKITKCNAVIYKLEKVLIPKKSEGM